MALGVEKKRKKSKNHCDIVSFLNWMPTIYKQGKSGWCQVNTLLLVIRTLGCQFVLYEALPITALCLLNGGWRSIKSERKQCEYDDYNTLVKIRYTALIRMAPPFMRRGTELPLWKCSILHTTLFSLKFNSCSQSAIFLLHAVWVCERVFFESSVSCIPQSSNEWMMDEDE